MPRDLFASDSDPKDESVVASPDATTPRSDTIDDVNADGSDGYNQFTIQRGEVRKETALQLHGDREIIKKRDNLHPYVQTLSISNLEDCVALEDAVFPEHERCSREKVERIFDYSLHLAWQFFQPLTLMHETSSRKGFTYHQLLNLYLDHCYSLENGCEATGFLRTLSVFNVFLSEAVTMLRYPTTLEETVLSEVLNQQLHFIYRLSVCPELCLGMFSTRSSPPDAASTTTYTAAHPPDSASPDLKSVLIAMVIATKIVHPSVTDESMDIPPNWQRMSVRNSGAHGHQENGRTIAIHSLGVLPAYQGKGLAKMLIKSYEQRMETSGIADRITLLAHDHLLKMYEGMGFEDRGKSDVKVGGGGWNNLTYEFSEHGPKS